MVDPLGRSELKNVTAYHAVILPGCNHEASYRIMMSPSIYATCGTCHATYCDTSPLALGPDSANEGDAFKAPKTSTSVSMELLDVLTIWYNLIPQAWKCDCSV